MRFLQYILIIILLFARGVRVKSDEPEISGATKGVEQSTASARTKVSEESQNASTIVTGANSVKTEEIQNTTNTAREVTETNSGATQEVAGKSENVTKGVTGLTEVSQKATGESVTKNVTGLPDGSQRATGETVTKTVTGLTQGSQGATGGSNITETTNFRTATQNESRVSTRGSQNGTNTVTSSTITSEGDTDVCQSVTGESSASTEDTLTTIEDNNGTDSTTGENTNLIADTSEATSVTADSTTPTFTSIPENIDITNTEESEAPEGSEQTTDQTCDNSTVITDTTMNDVTSEFEKEFTSLSDIIENSTECEEVSTVPPVDLTLTTIYEEDSVTTLDIEETTLNDNMEETSTELNKYTEAANTFDTDPHQEVEETLSTVNVVEADTETDILDGHREETTEEGKNSETTTIRDFGDSSKNCDSITEVTEGSEENEETQFSMPELTPEIEAPLTPEPILTRPPLIEKPVTPKWPEYENEKTVEGNTNTDFDDYNPSPMVTIGGLPVYSDYNIEETKPKEKPYRPYRPIFSPTRAIHLQSSTKIPEEKFEQGFSSDQLQQPATSTEIAVFFPQINKDETPEEIVIKTVNFVRQELVTHILTDIEMNEALRAIHQPQMIDMWETLKSHPKYQVLNQLLIENDMGGLKYFNILQLEEHLPKRSRIRPSFKQVYDHITRYFFRKRALKELREAFALTDYYTTLHKPAIRKKIQELVHDILNLRIMKKIISTMEEYNLDVKHVITIILAIIGYIAF